MDKVKILVACHKKAEVYQDNVYTPIQVGKSLRPDLDLGFITDDTGDNISSLNPYYCELTAEYWAWKNLDCEYIGLQHYRRYFDYTFTEDNVDKFFEDTDVVLANPYYLPRTIFDWWCQELVPEDIYISLKLLEKMYPDDYSKGQSYFTNKIFYPCNMFVCRKQLFDEFAAWQFKYLKKLREIVCMSDYKREQRLMGFIGEGIMPLYFMNRGYRIKTLPMVPMPGSKEKFKMGNWRRKTRALLLKALKHRNITYSAGIQMWLRQDGILDEENQIIL